MYRYISLLLCEDTFLNPALGKSCRQFQRVKHRSMLTSAVRRRVGEQVVNKVTSDKCI